MRIDGFRSVLGAHCERVRRDVYCAPGMHRDYIVGWWIYCGVAAVALGIAWPFVLLARKGGAS